MITSALFYHAMHLLHITIEIRNVCVFLAPFFSSLTVIVTYFLTKELKVSTFSDEKLRVLLTNILFFFHSILYYINFKLDERIFTYLNTSVKNPL